MLDFEKCSKVIRVLVIFLGYFYMNIIKMLDKKTFKIRMKI